MDVRYPNVTVTLVGEDGNVFNLIGIVRRALKREVGDDAAAEFVAEATKSLSYDEALQCMMRWVNVE